MRFEFIDRVKEGEVLAKSIFTSDGKVLLRSGITLTTKYIKRLKTLEVFYIYIEDERLDDINVEDKRLNDIKMSAVKALSTVVKNVDNNSQVGFRTSTEIVEELMDYILNMGDVSKSLYDIKTFDNYTHIHSIDTGIMSLFMGINFNIPKRELVDLGVAAILHDIGKLKIPKSIINKRGPLTNEEFKEMKKHPIYGADMLKKNYLVSDKIVRTVLQHHEKFNGKGYPYGLKDGHICDTAQIVSICDVYDSVSNDRVYRKKFSPNDAYELILSEANNSFRMDMVNNFRNTFFVYPLGCCVKLSNNIEGYVINQNSGYPDRPRIRVLYDHETREPIPFYEVDLFKEISLTIVGIV
ncbi:HD-GYP domain-containing protein [Clostridium sp.]|uniref:HD-GYP domain-containing protein n=1 Tax=Clostridium sp. TaxID=1506 RepID=UPI00346497DB